jgi:hypothetical protein
MRKSLVLVAVCLVVGGVGSPSFAGGKLAKPSPLVVKDASGDANGLNDQGGLLPASPPEQSNDAVSQKSADIVSFRLGRTDDGKKVKAFVGSLTLAAPPAQGTDYRIRMSTADCSTYFLEYEFAPGLGAQGEVRENCDGGTTATFDPVDATVTGNTITWTIPVKGMPGTAKLGTVFTVKGAQTSVETAVIFPGLDQVVTDKTFTVGQ